MRVDYLKSYHTFKSHLFNTSTHFTVFPLNHCLLIYIYIYIYDLILVHILSAQGNSKLPVRILNMIVLS